MIKIIEAIESIDTNVTYKDTWRLTFYFAAALAILIGLFWTIYQMYKKDNLPKKKLDENIIYNKSDDVIANDNNVKGKHEYNKIRNYYDVYQIEKKKDKKIQ